MSDYPDTLQVISNSPKNLQATERNSSAIMISWSSPCNDLLLNLSSYRVIYSGVEYDTSIRTVTLQQTTSYEMNNSYTTLIINLEAYTAYTIKVVAVNAIGESLPASIDFIKTSEASKAKLCYLT